MLFQASNLDVELFGSHAPESLEDRDLAVVVRVHVTLTIVFPALLFSDLCYGEAGGDQSLILITVDLRVDQPEVQIPLPVFPRAQFTEIVADVVPGRIGIDLSSIIMYVLVLETILVQWQ